MKQNQSTLVVHMPSGETRSCLLPPILRIGRAANSDVLIQDAAASRRHALIQAREDGSHVLIDLGSANGTRLNGESVQLPMVLKNGDSIKVADFELVFSQPSAVGEDLPAGDTLFNTADLTLDEAGPRAPRVQIIGGGPRMIEVLGQVRRAALSSVPILVSGETGTGKELIARAIHEGSARSSNVFVPINCSALPESLLESELFGHRRGAFTGAQQDRAGLFESAEGGTVFLDEIGELPLAMQPKLLRFLQDGEVRRVGEAKPRHVDVRVISATNRDLKVEIEREAFREDLFFRLSTFTIDLPPLRERAEDIPLLAERLLRTQCDLQRKRVRGIEPAALEALGRYEWPGNVRELENEIARAVAILDDGARISQGTFSARVADPEPAEATEGQEEFEASGTELRGAMVGFERKHIAQVLEQNGGNVSRAAEALGLSRGGLHKKLKELGLR